MDEQRDTVDRGLALRGLGLIGLLVVGLVGIVGYRVIDAGAHRGNAARPAGPTVAADEMQAPAVAPLQDQADHALANEPAEPPWKASLADAPEEGSVSPASFADEVFAPAGDDAVGTQSPVASLESIEPQAKPKPVFVAPGDR